MTSRASFDRVEFYMLGDDDVAKQAHATTTSKALFIDGLPANNGLYDLHMGTTELTCNCQTCFKNKIGCPSHDGETYINYPLQSPKFRKEIQKWLTIICHNCYELVMDREIPNVHRSKILIEYVKLHRSGSERHRKCTKCGADHPWISKDLTRGGILWREWFKKGDKKKGEKKEIIYNNIGSTILAGIADRICLLMGKSLDSHPKKLYYRDRIKIPGVAIRPEIRKIGGFRSTVSDATALLRTLLEYNAQIPKDIPAIVDGDLHAKLILMDLTFFEMIQGASPGSSNMQKLVTNMGKPTHSYASRLNKKTGRLRGNLMGRRTTKMMRSVITGDKSLRMDQVGVPRLMARTLWLREICRPWKRDRLTIFVRNGPNKYPGCLKIKRIETGREHYVELLGTDYILQDGDEVYRNLVDGDPVGFNREPALTFTSIAVLSARIVNGLTMRMNSAICVLFNADFDKLCQKQIAASSVELTSNWVNSVS